jgi:putative two-component system response regulator
MEQLPPRVLIVEDQEMNRRVLQENVALSGCVPVLAADGIEALDEIHASAPDAVILDLKLPRLDGVTVIRRIRENPEFGRMPIMVISAVAEMNKVRQCIDLGASDFLPKPFPPHALRSRLQYCLSNSQREMRDSQPFRAREFAREIVSSLDALGMATRKEAHDSSDTLLALLERMAPETRTHLGRTSACIRVMSRQLATDRRFGCVMDEQFIEDFARTASLHDIGKLAVPASILEKPGALNVEEHRIMRRHVTVGAEILRELYRRFPQERCLELAIELTLYHHERWDGMGYPFGLSGHSIPLAGRVMAIADVYDALRSERSYKSAYSHEKSRDIILAGSGKQFDPAIVAGFLACEAELELLYAEAEHELTPQALEPAKPEAPAPMDNLRVMPRSERASLNSLTAYAT